MRAGRHGGARAIAGKIDMKKLPKKILIKEVGPRDGLQNEKQFVPTDVKIAFIQKLIECGHRAIEITGFVHPKAIPQLADAEAVAKAFTQENRATLSALVPNRIGMEKAIACGMKEVAVFTAASETFTQKNIKCSIDESFERFRDVVVLAKKNKIKVRGYVSTAFVCPYEGAIDPKVTLAVTDRLFAMGCNEVSIGDTIGKATPVEVKKLFAKLARKHSVKKLAAHFHDTYGLAVANVVAALESGISIFDSSAAGLGGCPYAPGASGNVATEDLVYLFHQMDIPTGIDLGKLAIASQYIQQQLRVPTRSKVLQAMLAK